MASLASPTGSLTEAGTVPITADNLEALISQITLHHQSSVDQDSADSIAPGHQNSDKKTEDEQAKDKEQDFDDDMSDTSTSSASTLSSPWNPLEVFDFSQHDQVIADISAHLENYEAMALELGWEYSYADAILEQEEMRENCLYQCDGVISFVLRNHEEGDDDDDDSMAMLVAREVRYWQAQLDHANEIGRWGKGFELF